MDEKLAGELWLAPDDVAQDHPADHLNLVAADFLVLMQHHLRNGTVEQIGSSGLDLCKVLIGLVGQPVDLSRTPASLRTPTPEAGEHTDEVLSDYGIDADRISALRASGAI